MGLSFGGRGHYVKTHQFGPGSNIIIEFTWGLYRECFLQEAVLLFKIIVKGFYNMEILATVIILIVSSRVIAQVYSDKFNDAVDIVYLVHVTIILVLLLALGQEHGSVHVVE